MRTIYKYPLKYTESQSINLPLDSQILLFDIQKVDTDEIGTPTLWCLVDPEQPDEERKFLLVGTGAQVPWKVHHIGTVLSKPFVWHLFEKRTV